MAAAIGIIKSAPEPEKAETPPAPAPAPAAAPEPPVAPAQPPLAEAEETVVAEEDTTGSAGVSRNQVLIGAGVAVLLGVLAGSGGSSSTSSHGQ
ncbi:MAG: hypothetical protein IPM20_13325 [Gammaproteobacteria bacterium]|nr:hypothetical protein [Gammaproteobacteria bacterium]